MEKINLALECQTSAKISTPDVIIYREIFNKGS